jgi:hypothetical protein
MRACDFAADAAGVLCERLINLACRRSELEELRTRVLRAERHDLTTQIPKAGWEKTQWEE